MGTKHYRLLVICTAFCLVLGNCSPCYYTPNAQNVPLLDEGKEGTASLSFQGGLYTRSLNVQTAVSPVKHLGLMFNYHHFWTDYTKTRVSFWTGASQTEQGEIKGDFVEIGAGYYLPFQEELIFELYGGIGWGGIKNDVRFSGYNSSSQIRSSVKYTRYFVQPALGWSPNEHFELAFSNRFCLLHYKDLATRAGDITDIYELASINENPLFLFEPAITFRVGGKNIKFQYQVCYSNYFGNSNASFDPLAMSFAIFFRINGKKKE